MACVSSRRAAKIKQLKRLSHAANGVNYAEATREYANRTDQALTIISTEYQMEHEYCSGAIGIQLDIQLKMLVTHQQTKRQIMWYA